MVQQQTEIRKNTVFVSGNSGEWWIAKDFQAHALQIFRNQDRVSEMQVNLGRGSFVNIRGQSSGQSNRWVEVQDRVYPHKWRMIGILDIGEAPKPKDS